jgi:hypothetical protein
MTKKKINRKLALNKVSIANLDNEGIHELKAELPLIKGGNPPGETNANHMSNPATIIIATILCPTLDVQVCSEKLNTKVCLPW